MRLRLILTVVLAALVATTSLADPPSVTAVPPSPGVTPPSSGTIPTGATAPGSGNVNPSSQSPSLSGTKRAAKAFSLADMSDDVSQRLRDALKTAESPVRAAVRRKLDGLRQEIEDGVPAHRAGSHRAEVKELQQQHKRELKDLQAQIRAVAGAEHANDFDRLSDQVDERFARVNAALAKLERSSDEDQANKARKALATLLDELREPSDPVPLEPITTVTPSSPVSAPPPDIMPGRKLPQYAYDSLRERHYAQSGGMTPAVYRGDGFGFFKTATSLPPVASETTSDCNATSADFADDGVEVRITPDVRALAQELQYSPIRILRWMQTEVSFEPYWGSLKGSVGVLQTRAGNSTDQSSLLIALLRASNVPARFVRGYVALYDKESTDNPSGKAQRWLGTKNYSGSIAYLSLNVPATSYQLNGVTQGIKFYHVWVEACVPFSAYRGNLADTGGYRWLPLEPSIKDHDYQAGLAVNVPLDDNFYSPYLSKRTDKLPLDYFADKVEAVARTTKLDASIEDVPYRGTPRSLRMDVLPSATPFGVINFLNWGNSGSPEAAAIPDLHRHKFTVTIKNSAGTQLLSKVVTYPQSLFQRLTVSYQPADATSQTYWNNWGGSLTALPAGIVNVYPQIKLDGVADALVPGALTMKVGDQHAIIMKIGDGDSADLRGVTSGPCPNDSGNMSPPDADIRCRNKTIYTNIKAGGYYALGVNALQTSEALLGDRAELLATGVRGNVVPPAPNGGAGYDATVGELLHLVLQTYIHLGNQAEKRIAELRGFRSTGYYDIGLTGSDIKTDYIFDLPLAVKPAAAFVDFKGGRYGFTKTDSSAPNTPNAGESETDWWNRFWTVSRTETAGLGKLTVYAQSALEHRVWQEALRTDAVSTVRGLQFAQEQSIPLVTFSSANIANYNNLMEFPLDTSLRAQVQSAVAAGAIVIVPRRNIVYPDPVDSTKAWRGYVYMSENATTGNYGAVISGMFSGGIVLPGILTQAQSSPADQNMSGFRVAAGDCLFGACGVGANGLAVTAMDPVQMLTGNLVHDEKDFNIKGRGGLSIILARWYNSLNPTDGPLGYGWTHSFNQVVKLSGVENGRTKLSWINSSGGESYFSTPGTTGDVGRGVTLTNSPGTTVEFTRILGGVDDGKFRIRERNGLVYLFASVTGPNVIPSATSAVVARLLSITDRNGNALIMNYNAAGQLTSVSGSLGTALTFTWTGSRVSKISDLAGRLVSYSYDANGNLINVADSLRQNHGYSYYTSADGPKLDHHLKRYTLPRGNGMEFEYYSGGQVFRHTPFDISGNVIKDGAIMFHYNTFDRTAWTVNERGYKHEFTFDRYGNAVRIVDQNGAVQTMVYDCLDAAQPVGTVACKSPYNRLSSTDSIGRQTSYTYNAQNRVETSTLPSGAVLEYRDYNLFVQPQRVRDARGNWSWMAYDAKGNLTDAIRVKSGVVPAAGTRPAPTSIVVWNKYTYDTLGNLLTTTRVKDFASGSGPTLTQNWDTAQLNVQSLTRSGNRNGGTVTETTPSFTYDALGRFKRGVDARWYPMTLDYDALDRVISATDPLGKPHSFKYDANGNNTVIELIDGGVRIDSSGMTYNGLDRLVRTIDHAGNRSTFEYDDAGNRIGQTSPDNFSIGFDYDNNNKPFAAFDAEGNRVYTQFDTQGRPLSATDPNGNSTSYRYGDGDGRLKRVTQPAIPGQSAGRASEFDYDAAGNVIRNRVVAGDGSNAGRESLRFYDELGRTTRSVGVPDDSGNRLQTCTRYDNLSNVTEVWAGPTTDTTTSVCNFTDTSLKRQVSFTWDDFGHQLTRTDALGKLWTYGTDYYGNLIASQSPEQAKLGVTNLTRYTYDPVLNGLLKSRTVPATSGAAGQTVTYTRNALGQVTVAETRDSNNTLIVSYSYGYDIAHRVKSVTDSRGNKTLGYTWTPGGRLSKLTLADGSSTTHQWDYKYDAVGRLSAIVAPNGQSAIFAHDAGGRLMERNLGGGLTSKYEWNADGSLAAVEHLAGTDQLAKHAYSYNPWGSRSIGTDTFNGRTYTRTFLYDGLERLKTVSTGIDAEQETYGYDLYGNRTTKTLGSPLMQSWSYFYDAAQQINQIQTTLAGGTTVDVAFARHDDNGNLRKLCEAAGGGMSGTPTDCSGGSISTLNWDGLEQLARLDKTGAGAISETYAYDDAGRRLKKTSGATTTNYLYDGENILGEWNGSAISGVPTAVYAHGEGSDSPLLRLSGNTGGTDAAVRYYAQDGLGSVSALTSDARAQVNLARQAGTVLTTTGDQNSSYAPGSRLNDGVTNATTDFSTMWQGDANTGAAVTLSFTTPQSIGRVELVAYSSGFAPAAYVVEAQSSSGAWTQVASGGTGDFVAKDGCGGCAWVVKRFSPVSANALRVRFTQGGSVIGTISHVWLTEVQAWTTDSAILQRYDAWGKPLPTGTLDQPATPAPAPAVNLARQSGNKFTTSGEPLYTALPGSVLIDGVTDSGASVWYGDTNLAPTATLALASPQRVERVEIVANTAYWGLPGAYVVEVQGANGIWTQVASGGNDFAAENNCGGCLRSIKSFTPVNANALRVRFTQPGGSWILLNEVEIWGRSPPPPPPVPTMITQTAGSIPTYGYTGREPDQSGLMFYRARYYHPGIGRFISRDPLGLAAGINPYAYVNNNPVNFNDPSGEIPGNPQYAQIATSYPGDQLACDSCAGGIPGLQTMIGNAVAGSGYTSAERNPIGYTDPLGLAKDAPSRMTSNIVPLIPNKTVSAQSKGSQHRNGDTRPPYLGVLQTTLFGGMALGATGGAIAGAYVGVLEGAHLGLIGGLAVVDAVYSGAMAGALAGGAVGVGVGLTVIGGFYIYNSLKP